MKKRFVNRLFFLMVAPAGIEPATRGFSVLCSTDWAMKPKKWRFRRDLNPRSSAWQADVIDRYTTEPNGCGRWIWTNDLWVMSPASYRAAPSRDITNGGGKGIRTPAPLSRPPGFQDRSLQPDLGIPPLMVPKVGLEPTRGLNLAGF